MTVLTHCLPTGALQTAEIPVCNISDSTVTAIIPSGGVGHGNIRGIVVWLTGFDVFVNSGPGIPPYIPPDSPGAYYTTFYNALVADGWIFLAVPSNEWSAHGYGSSAVYNAVNADPGLGSNYVAGMMRWWDHIALYCAKKWPGMPIVPFGVSWGGFETIQVASGKTSTLLAAGAHVPATWISNANHLYTPPQNFGLINCSGLNVPVNALASVGIPMILGWGTTDVALGWTGTSTVAAGFTTTPAASVTTLPLNDATGYLSSPQVTALTTGGLGYATYEIGSISGNNLNGLTYLSGSGNVAVGTQVVQSPLQEIIAAAPANVVGHSTADTHEFTLADALYYSGTWFADVVDPLAPPMF